jgi:sugar phosphate isomerase/epimerase
MSQEVYYSVSSEQLDSHRESDDAIVATLETVSELGSGIEYVNSLSGEYASDIKADIKYADELGLEPRSIHLSVFEDLATDEGYVELNTSYRNAQRAFDPGEGSIQPFWEPNNLVFHPPVIDEDQDRQEVMEQVLRHMTKVNEINGGDEGSSGDLLIENMPPVHHTDYMISSPRDVRMMEDLADDLGATDVLKYTLDTGHTADCMEMAETMPSERVKEIHFHNKAQRDDGGWDNHIPPGEGYIDLEEFLGFYEEYLDHADIVVELKPSELDPESVEETYDFINESLG